MILFFLVNYVIRSDCLSGIFTFDLLHTMIEKIYVYEKELVDGEKRVKIEIFYRFIGNASVSEDKTTA